MLTEHQAHKRTQRLLLRSMSSWTLRDMLAWARGNIRRNPAYWSCEAGMIRAALEGF